MMVAVVNGVIDVAESVRELDVETPWSAKVGAEMAMGSFFLLVLFFLVTAMVVAPSCSPSVAAAAVAGSSSPVLLLLLLLVLVLVVRNVPDGNMRNVMGQINVMAKCVGLLMAAVAVAVALEDDTVME